MDESLDNYTEGKEPDKKNVMSCIIPFIWKSIKCKLTESTSEIAWERRKEGKGEGS